MEEVIRDNSATSGNTGRSKLRYPLRSASKQKEEKPSADLQNSSASKSNRSASSVSKSMGVVDVSGKNSAAKPPRRLSVPPKPATGSASKSIGNVTPISETRVKSSISFSGGKSDTLVSDASKSSGRRKFKLLSSPSYWLSQIKLSETDAKHSVSLGFFKLALEAGCEDIERMRDELKSYVCRHNLDEPEQPVKDLLESFTISGNLEQLQISETCSQMPKEVTHSSDDDVHSTTSTLGTGGLKPRSLNTDPQASAVAEPRKESTQKNTPACRTRGSSLRKPVNPKVVSDGKGPTAGKKAQKPSKQGSVKVKNQGKNVADEASINLSPTKGRLQDNKENLDAPQMEEIGLNDE